RIAPDADLKPSANAEIIDAHGCFLMPGLWDNHQHFSDNDGALDLANGVTSARDMANDTDTFLQRVERFDNGSELGPRVLKAGIIDGTGEFAGPTKMRIDTAEQAVQDIDWYADHGYAQLKIYSSIKPELVPVMADHAHARAMLSGALEVPKDKEKAYREAFPAMLRLLKALHDAGVTIIPGTDALAGYTLHHELELYVQAGIAPAEVLRMATWTPALVMGVDKDRGVIAPGKLADMILIDGDPTKNIRDINNITTVIKGGKVYDPAAIEKALGITPRETRTQ